MLQTLRKLFEPETAAPAPQAGGGKLTLRDILLRDWDELWYQPKIELRTKRLVGAEGLLRARLPDGSIVRSRCLPARRQRRGDAGAHRARHPHGAARLRGLRGARRLGKTLGQRAGLGAGQIADRADAARASAVDAELAGPHPRSHRDEILHDLKLANHVAEELRSLRCTLALDDFGAGYSSLARLRQLPFSELKIDRSYVSNCHDDKVNGGLCETIVKLAKRFELMTVAEGIENSAESDKLKAIGCDIGQGYLFAKPMPKAEFVAALSAAAWSDRRSGRQNSAWRRRRSRAAHWLTRNSVLFPLPLVGRGRGGGREVAHKRGRICCSRLHSESPPDPPPCRPPQGGRENCGELPMPAYWVARSKINDSVEYKKYTDLVPAIIAKYGGKVLARGGNFQIMEGPQKFQRFVVIEFPTFEQGVACFTSKEYDAAAAFRRRNGAGEVETIMVDGGDATT